VRNSTGTLSRKKWVSKKVPAQTKASAIFKKAVMDYPVNH
jgi:hypothetical protein